VAALILDAHCPGEVGILNKCIRTKDVSACNQHQPGNLNRQREARRPVIQGIQTGNQQDKNAAKGYQWREPFIPWLGIFMLVVIGALLKDIRALPNRQRTAEDKGQNEYSQHHPGFPPVPPPGNKDGQQGDDHQDQQQHDHNADDRDTIFVFHFALPRGFVESFNS